MEDFDLRGSYGIFQQLYKLWKKQTISFRPKNPALDYKPNCSVKSTFATDVVQRCNNLPPGHDTTLRFNWFSSELHINHTWICPRNARSVEAKASIPVPLSCVDAVSKPILLDTTDQRTLQRGRVECERITFQIPVA